MKTRKQSFAMAIIVIITLALVAVIGFGLAGCSSGDHDHDSGRGLTVNGKPYTYSIYVTADDPYELIFWFIEPIDSFTAADVTLSGISGVTKGTMSFIGLGKRRYWASGSNGSFNYSGYFHTDGYRYTLPISGITDGGELTVTIGTFSTTIYYKAPANGIYLGINKFAGYATALNLKDDSSYGLLSGTNSGAPVLLDNPEIIQGVLNNQYNIARGSEDGSAVYYAVHKALATLKNTESRYPEPDSVYIITFTDGKDNGSSGQSQVSPIENKTFTTTSDYIAYVKNEIASRKIAGKNITAYSIGVKGSDIQTTTDQTDFTNLLVNIAGPGNNRELTDYNSVNATFDEIANSLIQSISTNFTLSTTLLESGTKVRMTFDNLPANATQEQITGATRFIEGTVNSTGSGASLTYTFTNITYGGITSGVGTGPLTGVRNGTQVNYLFRNITGYSYATDRANIKQWLKAPGASGWTINSEYQTSNVTNVYGNTVIYLVLDCSSSISSNINSIRIAVNNFITKIYNARYKSGY